MIGFAGDAITCWFDEAEGFAALRAATCALNPQAVMAPFVALTLPGCRSSQADVERVLTAVRP